MAWLIVTMMRKCVHHCNGEIGFLQNVNNNQGFSLAH